MLFYVNIFNYYNAVSLILSIKRVELASAGHRQAKRAIGTSTRGKENKLNLQIHQDIFFGPHYAL